MFEALKTDETEMKLQTIENVIVKYQYAVTGRQFCAEFTYKEYEYMLNINEIDENMALEYVSILIK